MAGDTVTMSASHYEQMRAKAAEHRASGLYGEWALTHAKKNKNAFLAIAGAGVATWFLFNKSLSDKISLFKEHWWLKGLLVMVLGWYLWRKQSPWAMVVLSLGAALFVLSYRAEQNKGKKPGEQVETGDYNWDTTSGQWVKSGTGADGEVVNSPTGTDQPRNLAGKVFDTRAA